MPIALTCPTCSTKLKAPDAAAGRKLKCPKCAAVIAVPPASANRPPPAPAAGPPARPPQVAVAAPANHPPSAAGGIVPAAQRPAQPRTDYRDCPFCGEPILPAAKKCKHCGEMLDPVLRSLEDSRRAAAQSPVVMHVNQQVVVPGNPLSKSSNPLLSALGNVLWVVLGGGIILFLEYLVGGFLLCLTIVGIPFGLQCIKLANLALLPFGKQIVHRESATGCLTTIMNLAWVVIAGVWIALTHVFFALLCAITVILLPFAKQHMKLAALALQPFGKQVC